MEREGCSPFRIFRQALRISEIFIAVLVLAWRKSRRCARQVFPGGRGCFRATRFSGIDVADELSAFRGKPADCERALEIGVEWTLDGWWRGICCKSHRDTPIRRRIRVCSGGDGDPPDLKNRRDGQIEGQPVVMQAFRCLA